MMDNRRNCEFYVAEESSRQTRNLVAARLNDGA
jgi:hypothetical protein